MVGRYGRRWIRRCGNNVAGGTFSRVYMLTSIWAWVGFDPATCRAGLVNVSWNPHWGRSHVSRAESIRLEASCKCGFRSSNIS